MLAEWEQRATREGDLSVMSCRYPYQRCEEESRRYVAAVMEFLGEDIKDKDVLEIGCGTGRITEKLCPLVRKLTCLDISRRMLERNRERLGDEAPSVRYVCAFGQDYRTDTKHDLALSSLVMSHNVDRHEFRELAMALSMCSDTIFLFEHTDTACQVSPHTQPRTEDELALSFPGYRLVNRRKYRLFNDNIAFLKFVR